MQPLWQRILLRPRQGAFLVKEGKFYIGWHHHAEIEITLVEQGNGIRYVGDSVEYFEAGDLVLVGSLVPHVWVLDSNYAQVHPDAKAASKVILFSNACLGDGFFELIETQQIGRLLELAKRGIKFMGSARDQLKKMITSFKEFDDPTSVDVQMLYENGSERRIILLLEILGKMAKLVARRKAEGTDYAYLNQENSEYPLNNDLPEPLSAALFFIANKFHKKISIEDIARAAVEDSGVESRMSFRTFNRASKNRVGKSVGVYLQEIRLEQAMVRLIETDESIQSIAKSCGFFQQSHFSNQFKKFTGKKPSEYREESRGPQSLHSL